MAESWPHHHGGLTPGRFVGPTILGGGHVGLPYYSSLHLNAGVFSYLSVALVEVEEGFLFCLDVTETHFMFLSQYFSLTKKGKIKQASEGFYDVIV